MPLPLNDLIRALPLEGDTCLASPSEVTAVTADSRQVRPGALFVAIRGATADGHRFIADAIARGAVAIVGADPLEALPVPYLHVADTRAALAVLAAAFYGFPSRQLSLVGVTGTDGKTTTCNLIYHVLRAAGQRAGMISTISAHIDEADLDTGLHVTTPDAPDVQRYLAQMVDAGCQTAVLETTSHGLHQGRVAACDFDVAVVTNVTHEHLDYHGTWDAYLEAKALLFRSLAHAERKPGQPKAAVLNADDASYGRLQGIWADMRLSYSLETVAVDLFADQIDFRPDRTTFVAHTPAGALPMATRLVGRFNVYNCLAAVGAGLGLGLSLDVIAQGLASLSGVAGRMERIDRGQHFLAIVDFAHTPVSLARALEAVRPMTLGRVIAVFGSAGLRDQQKRSLMAEIALRLADFTILTAEDPRTESLDMILAQMAEGALRAGGQLDRNFAIIPDRTEAIRRAVAMVAPGDAVLIAGKGHERSMCFGAVEHPWRDQAVAAWAIERRLGLTHAPPPYYLPTQATAQPL
jgi:UDP-N-acetylmuramoyl-L-alanyl-D-glutamate--2,6-diaminopimelate ligase